MKRHADLLQCSLCEFSTPLQIELRAHTRVKHSDSKPYSCVICGKQFKMKSCMNVRFTFYVLKYVYVFKCDLYCEDAFNFRLTWRNILANESTCVLSVQRHLLHLEIIILIGNECTQKKLRIKIN